MPAQPVRFAILIPSLEHGPHAQLTKPVLMAHQLQLPSTVNLVINAQLQLWTLASSPKLRVTTRLLSVRPQFNVPLASIALRELPDLVAVLLDITVHLVPKTSEILPAELVNTVRPSSFNLPVPALLVPLVCSASQALSSPSFAQLVLSQQPVPTQLTRLPVSDSALLAPSALLVTIVPLRVWVPLFPAEPDSSPLKVQSLATLAMQVTFAILPQPPRFTWKPIHAAESNALLTLFMRLRLAQPVTIVTLHNSSLFHAQLVPTKTLLFLKHQAQLVRMFLLELTMTKLAKFWPKQLLNFVLPVISVLLELFRSIMSLADPATTS